MIKPSHILVCALTAALYAAPAAADCYCPQGSMLHSGAGSCMIPDGKGGMVPIGSATCTSNNVQPYSGQPNQHWWSRGLSNKAIKVDPPKPGHVVGILEPDGLHGSLGGGSGSSVKPPATFADARSQALRLCNETARNGGRAQCSPKAVFLRETSPVCIAAARSGGAGKARFSVVRYLDSASDNSERGAGERLPKMTDAAAQAQALQQCNAQYGNCRLVETWPECKL